MLLLYLHSILDTISCTEAETRLHAHLFTNYNKDVRPAPKDSEPVNVLLNIRLEQLLRINEKYQEITMAIWLRQSWTDLSLAWNASEYNGIKQLHLPPQNVWLPDLVLYNNLHDDNSLYAGHIDKVKGRIILYDNGLLFWLTPIIVKARCSIDIAHFPFDIQKCHLKFGSWTYDGAQLDLNTTYGVENGNPSNLEWITIHTSGVRHNLIYGCCPNPFPDITFYFHFQRRSLFYVLNLILPIALITALTTVSFFLPEESGERLSLAVTLMLASTVFMLIVAEKTPETSDSVPVISVYFMACMILMFTVIVGLAYSSRVHHRRTKHDKPMGHWTRKIIFNKLAYVLGTRRFEDRVGVGSPAVNTRARRFDKKDASEAIVEENSSLYPTSHMAATMRKPSKSASKTSVKSLHNELMVLEEIRRSHYTCEEEWIIVAKTVDRCLFFIYALTFVLITIGCFGPTHYTT